MLLVALEVEGGGYSQVDCKEMMHGRRILILLYTKNYKKIY